MYVEGGVTNLLIEIYMCLHKHVCAWIMSLLTGNVRAYICACVCLQGSVYIHVI